VSGTDSCAHIKAFIPVGIQRLLDDAGRLGLLAIEGSDSEGVGKAFVWSACIARMNRIRHTKDISFVEAISGNDCTCCQ